MSTLLSSLLSLRWLTLGGEPAEPEQRYSLDYPLTPLPRMAVLGWQFAPARGLRRLSNWSAEDLEAAAPESLAASPADLLRVAALHREGSLWLPSLSYPLVAILRRGEPPLTAAQHDELWQEFGLPVFQQIREPDGRLLAYDCEAADGFHVLEPALSLERMTPLPGPCPCGDATTRVRPAATGRARAATAIL